YLCRLISIIAHGLSGPILMSWPEGGQHQNRGDEVRKRLASLLQEGATLVVLDILPRGSAFSSPELDAFVTADDYSDRKLGHNDGQRSGGPNRCLVLGTGNAVLPSGDTADRTLLVRLCSNLANPRSRPASEYTIPNIEEYAVANRARLLGACLT